MNIFLNIENKKAGILDYRKPHLPVGCIADIDGRDMVVAVEIPEDADGTLKDIGIEHDNTDLMVLGDILAENEIEEVWGV